MTKNEFQQYLLRLNLDSAEAAQLLSVTPRTMRRWLEGEEIPDLAERAIHAWVRLHERYLPWRPDNSSIAANDQDQIARLRTHAIDLDEVLGRAEKRANTRLPWTVDWNRGLATLGPMEISFHKLPNGGFSLGTYRRKDSDPDTVRDREMIEDAIFCIADALKKKNPDFGPVALVVHDGPAKGRTEKQQIEKFLTAKDAIKRACEAMGSPGFHEPFIITESPSELLWDAHELRRECESRANAPPALTALADYTRTHSALFVRNGPQMMGPAETAQREQRIKALADKVDELATQAANGSVRYQDFEEVLGALHAAGFFPRGDLVSAVAKSLFRD
jgi:hypothetical protein